MTIFISAERFEQFANELAQVELDLAGAYNEHRPEIQTELEERSAALRWAHRALTGCKVEAQWSGEGEFTVRTADEVTRRYIVRYHRPTMVLAGVEPDEGLEELEDLLA